MGKDLNQFLEELDLNEAVDYNRVSETLASNQPINAKKNSLKVFLKQLRTEVPGAKRIEAINKFKDLIRSKGKENETNELLSIFQLGEDTMAKTNSTAKLDTFLEGIESFEVSKKPKFHSIYRLYEATDADEQEDKELEETEDQDADDVDGDSDPINEAKKAKADDEESDGEEEAETDGEEDAEQEAGDDDEEGGEDEEPETDDDEEKIDEGVVGDLASEVANYFKTAPTPVLDALKKAMAAKALGPELTNIVKQLGNKTPAKAPVAEAETCGGDEDGQEDDQAGELEEGATGYAAGIRGLPKNAGGKNMKSGSNKVPTPKMAITGDKKLLKKPVTLKGDSYPKSSVAAKKGAKK